MKKLLLTISVLFSLKASAQISFMLDGGTDKYKAITMLVNAIQPEKTLYVFSANDYPPTMLTPLRDTTILGQKVYVMKMGEQVKPYYMIIDSSIAAIKFYDQKMESIGNFVNDSYVYRNEQSKANTTKSSLGDQILDDKYVRGIFNFMLGRIGL